MPILFKPMPRQLYILIVLWSLLWILPLHAKVVPAGLSFFSNDRPIAERTQYDVFYGYREIQGDSLVITFELSVLDPDFFGHIMDLFSPTGEEFNLVLVNFRDKDNVYIDFNDVSSGVKFSFPIPRSECREGYWHTVRLAINFMDRKIGLTVNGSSQSALYDYDRPMRKVMCVMGRSAKYTDVPRMAVRNFEYTNRHDYFCFPLTETQDVWVHDTRGKAVGYVKCPEWLANRHFHWKKEMEFWQKGLTYIAHDSRCHKIIGYSFDSVFVYDISGRDKLVSQPNRFSNRFPITSGGLFFNKAKDEFILYNTLPSPQDKHSIARYDYINGKFTPLDLAVADSKLHHHNAFTDSRGENLYIFGGYGNYSYSSNIYRHSPQSHSWEKELFSGDTISPRFFAAMGCDYRDTTPNAIYLFGGFGNNSGKQENGAWNSYDLYRINVDERHISKLFDVPLCDSIDFIPTGQLLVMPDLGYFYVFGYDHNAPRTKGYVYRIGMDGQSFQRVSDGIDIVSEKIESRVYFFYDDFYQKLICATQEIVQGKGALINLYSLAFPPAVPDEISARDDSGFWRLSWIIVGSLLLIIGCVVVVQRRKRATDSSMVLTSASNVKPYAEATISVNREPQANSVWLLGDFSVFDRNARDISYRFSSKIRQLFLLVLLHSGKDTDGISSAEISTILWPDKKDSKNIRGVTFKALRDILADLDGLTLKKENHKWHIEIDSCVCTCDYTIIMNTLPGRPSDSCSPYELTDLLMRGDFIHSSNYKWMDSFKFRFEEHIERLVRPLLDNALSAKDYPQVYKLANSLQFSHPLNEEYLKIQLKVLKNMGKHYQALSKFRLFAQEYRKSYGVELKQEDFL
jgi:DNA-binding SARP family transcriptional activator